MRKTLSLLILLACITVHGQVIISPNPLAVPNTSAMLEMDATTKGMLIPRMTATQRKVIATPAEGLWIYQIDENPGYFIYTGAQWMRIAKDRTVSGKVVFDANLEAITSLGGYSGYTASYIGSGQFNMNFAPIFPAGSAPTIMLTSETIPALSGIDPSVYCPNTFTANCTSFINSDYLNIVRIGSRPGGVLVPLTPTGPVSFDNGPTGCNNTPGNYVDYFSSPNTIQATLYGTNTATGGFAGSDFTIAMASGPEWLDNLFAWIDWNQDGDFYDSQEVIFEGYFTGSGSNNPAFAAVLGDLLTVPNFAANGYTVMRAVSKWVVTIPNPCGSSSYGETQDYKILVLGGSGVSTAEPRPTNCNVSNITNTGFQVYCSVASSGIRQGTGFDFYATEH